MNNRIGNGLGASGADNNDQGQKRDQPTRLRKPLVLPPLVIDKFRWFMHKADSFPQDKPSYIKEWIREFFRKSGNNGSRGLISELNRIVNGLKDLGLVENNIIPRFISRLSESFFGQANQEPFSSQATKQRAEFITSALFNNKLLISPPSLDILSKPKEYPEVLVSNLRQEINKLSSEDIVDSLSSEILRDEANLLTLADLISRHPDSEEIFACILNKASSSTSHRESSALQFIYASQYLQRTDLKSRNFPSIFEAYNTLSAPKALDMVNLAIRKIIKSTDIDSRLALINQARNFYNQIVNDLDSTDDFASLATQESSFLGTDELQEKVSRDYAPLRTKRASALLHYLDLCDSDLAKKELRGIILRESHPDLKALAVYKLMRVDQQGFDMVKTMLESELDDINRGNDSRAFPCLLALYYANSNLNNPSNLISQSKQEMYPQDYRDLFKIILSKVHKIETLGTVMETYIQDSLDNSINSRTYYLNFQTPQDPVKIFSEKDLVDFAGAADSNQLLRRNAILLLSRKNSNLDANDAPVIKAMREVDQPSKNRIAEFINNLAA